MNRPIIGVSCNFRPHEGENGLFNLDKSYTDAIYNNGGIPQIIPMLPVDEISLLINMYDGILLSGGGGLLPHVKKMKTLPSLKKQNPDRYKFEAELIKHATKEKIPVLGVCRGHQMINDIFGGTIKNIPDKKHRQDFLGCHASHSILVQPETNLYNSIQSKKTQVNSFHSQVIDIVGKNLEVTAYSDDELIESIEANLPSFMMGVQFHPEFMPMNHEMMNIYKKFIQKSKTFKDEKENQ